MGFLVLKADRGSLRGRIVVEVGLELGSMTRKLTSEPRNGKAGHSNAVGCWHCHLRLSEGEEKVNPRLNSPVLPRLSPGLPPQYQRLTNMKHPFAPRLVLPPAAKSTETTVLLHKGSKLCEDIGAKCFERYTLCSCGGFVPRATAARGCPEGRRESLAGMVRRSRKQERSRWSY